MWRQFSIALSFLTIFRLPGSGEITPGDTAGYYSFFPLIGFLVGLSALSVIFMFQAVMPPLLLAVCVCAGMTLITRGLHLDGLADLADGVGGGYSPARRLEIMKDSATGAFGSLALVFAIVFKVSAMDTLIIAKAWAPFMLIPALSRFAIVLTAYRNSYARPEGGLAKSSVDHMTFGIVLGAGLTALGLALLLAPRLTLIYLGAAIMVSLLMRFLAQGWLGGITGDVLGAVNEVAEILLFTLAACIAYA
jgi:adenosylcobinamide-GDP ribazoletransferase